MALWVVGLAIFHDNASKLSRGYKRFLPKIVLLALLTANLGLVVALIFAASMRGYVYPLYTVWPVHFALAWKVFNEKVKVDEVGKEAKKLSYCFC